MKANLFTTSLTGCENLPFWMKKATTDTLLSMKFVQVLADPKMKEKLISMYLNTLEEMVSECKANAALVNDELNRSVMASMARQSKFSTKSN
jgi:hypothetical protein